MGDIIHMNLHVYQAPYLISCEKIGDETIAGNNYSV